MQEGNISKTFLKFIKKYDRFISSDPKFNLKTYLSGKIVGSNPKNLAVLSSKNL